MTITEFLLARIEEDEREAEMGGEHNGRGVLARDNYGCLLIQPNRVLAECAAKRAIIALHKPITQHWWPGQVPVEVCEMCDDERWECETIRALASVYSGHKDYNWREWAL